MTVNRANVVASGIVVPISIDISMQLPLQFWRILILSLADGRCDKCKAEINLHCHHIDGNRENNCLLNGLCLCGSCYSEWHGALQMHTTNRLMLEMQADRLAQLMKLAA